MFLTDKLVMKFPEKIKRVAQSNGYKNIFQENLFFRKDLQTLKMSLVIWKKNNFMLRLLDKMWINFDVHLLPERISQA